MIVTEEEFREYEKAISYVFKNESKQPGALALRRYELTHLSINKYIYIYDNYIELKIKFNKK